MGRSIPSSLWMWIRYVGDESLFYTAENKGEAGGGGHNCALLSQRYNFKDKKTLLQSNLLW